MASSKSGEGYRFGYQGDFAEEDKETGWNFFEARAYDPVRQYASGYVGMGNNPVNMIDSDGNLSFIPGAAGFVIGASMNLYGQYYAGQLDFTSWETYARAGAGGTAGMVAAYLPSTYVGIFGGAVLNASGNILDQSIYNGFNFNEVDKESVAIAFGFGFTGGFGGRWFSNVMKKGNSGGNFVTNNLLSLEKSLRDAGVQNYIDGVGQLINVPNNYFNIILNTEDNLNGLLKNMQENINSQASTPQSVPVNWFQDTYMNQKASIEIGNVTNLGPVL